MAPVATAQQGPNCKPCSQDELFTPKEPGVFKTASRLPQIRLMRSGWGPALVVVVGGVPALHPTSAPTGPGGAYPVHPCSVPVPTIHPHPPTTPVRTLPKRPDANILSGFSRPANSWGWWPAQHPGPAPPRPRSPPLGPGLAPGQSPPSPRAPSPSSSRPASARTQLPVPHGNSCRHNFRRCSRTAALTVRAGGAMIARSPRHPVARQPPGRARAPGPGACSSKRGRAPAPALVKPTSSPCGRNFPQPGI